MSLVVCYTKICHFHVRSLFKCFFNIEFSSSFTRYSFSMTISDEALQANFLTIEHFLTQIIAHLMVDDDGQWSVSETTMLIGVANSLADALTNLGMTAVSFEYFYLNPLPIMV